MMAPSLNSPLPAMGASEPQPLLPPASSQAAEPLRGLRRYKMINLVGDGTYGLVYLAYNQVKEPFDSLNLDTDLIRSRKRRSPSRL